jgi:signal transduction histidine kinase
MWYKLILVSFFIIQQNWLRGQFKLGNDSLAYLANYSKGEKYLSNGDFSNAEIYFQKLHQDALANKNSTAEAWALTKLNEVALEKGDYKTHVKTTDHVFEIGRKLADNYIQGVSLLQKAQYSMYDNNFVAADKLFEKALLLLPFNHSQTALAWNDRGYNASKLAEYQLAAEYYLKALAIYEKLNHAAGLALTYSNLSVLYYDIQQSNAAIEYAKKSITIRESQKDYSRLVNSYCNLSQMYLTINLKEADKYAKLCKQIAELVNNDDSKIYAAKVEGLVKNYSGDKTEWLTSALKLLQLYKQKDSFSTNTGRQYLSIAIGMSEARLDSVATLHYFDKALEIASKNKDRETIRDTYGNYNIFYRLRNDLSKAYPLLRKYHAIKDSIINEKTILSVSELKTKYESEKKDNEINRLYTEQKLKELKIGQLNTEQQIKQLEIEKQLAVIKGNTLLAKKKEDEIELLKQKRALQEFEIARQTESLQKQVLVNQTQQQQLDIAEKDKQLKQNELYKQKQWRNILLISVISLLALVGILFNRYQLKKKLQEQRNLLAVREKIAKDLHDDVGSTLSSIKILSEVASKNLEKDTEKVVSLIQKITTQSEQMQHGISDIVWAVMPDNDKVENLLVKLKEYCNAILEPKQINTEFEISNEALWKTIAMSQRKNILLICREAINNIAKYAKCDKVKIFIDSTKNTIRLQISDNGTGFDLGGIKSGNGLKNMETRTADLNGSFKIESSRGVGTKISIEFPIIA